MATRWASQGSAALGVVFLAATLVVLGAPFLLLPLNLGRMEERVDRNVDALAVAEAGAEQAIWEFNNGGAFPVATWSNMDGQSGCTAGNQCRSSNYPVAGPSGTIGTAAIFVDGTQIGYAAPVVTSTGQVAGTGLATAVRVTLQRQGATGRFQYGALGDTSTSLSMTTTTDSYNSTLGAYSAQPHGSQADLATNSTDSGAIHIMWNSVANGNASVGKNGDPMTGIQVDTGGVLNGSRSALPNLITFVGISSPPSCGAPGSWTDLVLTGGAYTLLPPGDYCFARVFVTGSSTMLETSGQVRIYARDYVAIEDGAKVQADNGISRRPEHLQFFMVGTGAMHPPGAPDQPAVCSAGASFCVGAQSSASGPTVTAVVYAQSMPIRIGGFGQGAGTDVYGALIGSQVMFYDADFHYDTNLGNIDIAGIPSSTTTEGSVAVSKWERVSTP